MASITLALQKQIFKLWRQQRFKLFKSKIAPAAGDHLIDIGGYPWLWIKEPQPVQRIDCINLHPINYDPSLYPNYNIRTLVGDGCHLQAEDGSYDIAYSNSVIEHVGDYQKQREFAREIRRVGQRVWMQTPAYECPVEPHYLGLFVHWLPPRVRRQLLRWVTLWGWMDRPSKQQIDDMIQEIRLMKKKEVQELFPDCTIITERLFGIFPKSYIAVRTANQELAKDTISHRNYSFNHHGIGQTHQN